LRPLGEASWGLALAAGTTRHPDRASGNGWPGDAYLNVPLSVPVVREAWIAHFNAGAVRQRDRGRTLGTWSFGNELRLRDDSFVTAEVFRSDFGRASYQLGFRRWLLHDRIEVDGSAGTRAGAFASARWLTLGLHLQFPPFSR
jgi:hypothetical protein